MTPSRDIDHRIHLVLANESLIALSVAKVADRFGRRDVFDLVLDTRDCVARDLARAIVEGATDLDLDVEAARILSKPDVVPTGLAGLAVVPLAAAMAGFAVSHHGLRRGSGRHLQPGGSGS